MRQTIDFIGSNRTAAVSAAGAGKYPLKTLFNFFVIARTFAHMGGDYSLNKSSRVTSDWMRPEYPFLISPFAVTIV